jgi:hypothetical protein
MVWLPLLQLLLLQKNEQHRCGRPWMRRRSRIARPCLLHWSHLHFVTGAGPAQNEGDREKKAV